MNLMIMNIVGNVVGIHQNILPTVNLNHLKPEEKEIGMIVKLKTHDEGWVYYNIAQRFKVRTLTREQYKNGIELDTPDRIEIAYSKNKKPTGKVIVINFEDANDFKGENIIYTNLAVYLINEEGKTIEKLN